jgi:hypothetical protein
MIMRQWDGLRGAGAEPATWLEFDTYVIGSPELRPEEGGMRAM